MYRGLGSSKNESRTQCVMTVTKLAVDAHGAPATASSQSSVV